MKKTQLVYSILAASAVLSLGSAFTALADWQLENDRWVYLDNHGQRVRDSWQESNGSRFYLGSDGYMAVNTLVEDNDSLYYVNSSGAMVVNDWKYIDNPSWQSDQYAGSQSWYYFGSNGRAYKNRGDKAGIYEIKEKKYAFDSNGRMMTGWISEAGEYVDEDSWTDGLYYADPAGSGHLLTDRWLSMSVDDSENEDELYPTYYFYFTSGGKKTRENDRTIDGKEYYFDERGVAVSGWQKDEEDDTWKYYGESDDCSLHTGWFTAEPDDEMLDMEDHDDDNFFYGDQYRFYATSNGKVAASEFRTIDGRSYGFGKNGAALNGLYQIVRDGSKSIQSYQKIDTIDDMPEDIANSDIEVYYFADDGSTRTGTVNVALDDDDYTFAFKTSGTPRGRAENGVSGNYLYSHGRRMQAEDGSRYQVIEWDGQNYLISESGSIAKKRTNIKDADGIYYCTDGKGIVLHSDDERCDGKH